MKIALLVTKFIILALLVILSHGMTEKCKNIDVYCAKFIVLALIFGTNFLLSEACLV